MNHDSTTCKETNISRASTLSLLDTRVSTRCHSIFSCPISYTATAAPAAPQTLLLTHQIFAIRLFLPFSQSIWAAIYSFEA